MIVGAIQNREVTPTPASFVNSLQFACDPAGFVFRRGQLDDANLLAFRLIGAENFLGEIRADRVLADDLGGDTQDIRSGAVIFSKADAEPGGVLTFVNENVTKVILQRGAEGGVALQQTDCSGDQGSEGRALLFAQQLFAGTVGTSNLLFAGHGCFAFRERVRVERGTLGLQL